jgi:Uma2 family endonuclease
MSLPLSELVYTNEEYLAMEREAEERHEYIDGYIYEMAGESQEHGEICSNLSGIIVPQISGTNCRARIGNTKVRTGPRPKSSRSRRGMFSYPDLLIVCGEMRFHDEHRDVLINPTVIIEVLSESTERFDRGEKFLRYQIWNPSLREYLLVSQIRPVIEHYVRQPNDSWTYTIYRGLDESLKIESIDCTLNLNTVYERMKFPSEETEGVEGEDS